MYSIFAYGKMIADPVRMDAYARAIQSTLKPGMTVLDIGTGTGIFAMLACRAGARRVYAVDPSEAVQLGREIARANGMDDRIVFIQGLSSEIELPEPVDLIVSDLRGILPFFSSHLSDIIDARNRFLAPDGQMIPRLDSLWGALAEAPEVYEDYTDPWSGRPFGLDMTAATRYLLHNWIHCRGRSMKAVSAPCRWFDIDYRTATAANGSGRMGWPVEETAACHGFVLWFETRLTAVHGFSNAPEQPESIYGKAFFPFLEPLQLRAGDTVEVVLKAEYVGQEYIWRWNTNHLAGSGKKKARFDQSTFFGTPLSRGRLAEMETSHRPALNPTGEVDRHILALMDGSRTIQDIAEKIRKKYPDRYPTVNEAVDRVCRLSNRYAKRDP
jgi:protein arginine N-methyltransferase 1